MLLETAYLQRLDTYIGKRLVMALTQHF